MSTKTYVGERLSNEVFIAPGPAYLLYPPNGDKLDEVRSRFRAPEHGSGPWFVARFTSDHESPLTDGCRGLTAGYGSDGTQQFGNRGHDADLTKQSYCYYQSGSGAWGRYPGIFYFEYEAKDYTRIWTSSGHTYAIVRGHVRKYQWYGESYRSPYPSGFPGHGGIGDYAGTKRLLSWCRANKDTVLKLVQDEDYTKEISSRYTLKLFVRDFAPTHVFNTELYQSSDLYLETGILPGHWARGLETAYTEAAKSLPQAAVNVAANVLEAANIIASLFSGSFLSNIPKNAKEAWLSYRYAYSTTKLDIREARAVFDRLDDLASSNDVRVFGSYTSGEYTYRVGFSIDTAQIVPSDVSNTLRRFGLELNAVNAWDMIPYSFVVDWFIPMQQILEYFQNLDACQLKPHDLWWSILTSMDGCELYSRLPGRQLFTMPYLDIRGTGSRTVFLRIADAVALFT